MLSLESELRRTHALRRWEERLQQTDSVFARLVFVSQLRDAPGRYIDPFLRRWFSIRTYHQIVANAHREIFREWLDAFRVETEGPAANDGICVIFRVPRCDLPGLW